jgi:hypothetical protein
MGAMTKPTKRTFVDVTSGDFIEYYGEERKPAFRRSPFGKRWSKVAFEAHIQLATTPGIFTNDFRVFHLLMPTIEQGNVVYINQAMMARQLKMPASVVSRSIRKLVEKGVLERAESASGRVYRLNPMFAWYGADNGAHTSAIKSWGSSKRIQ